MKWLWLAIVTMLCLPASALASPGANVAITATGSYISIINTGTEYDFGTLVAGGSKATAPDGSVVTNVGTVSVNITISGTDMTGESTTWTLSDDGEPGIAIYALKASSEALSPDDFTIVVRRNPCYNTLVDSLEVGNLNLWGLKIYAPTSNIGDEEVMGTVTLTASEVP